MKRVFLMQVASTELVLYSACNQMDGQPATTVTIGDAVKAGIKIWLNTF